MGVIFAIVFVTATASPPVPAPTPPPSYVETLKAELPPLLPLIDAAWVREVFSRVAELPPKPSVAIYRDKANDRWLSDAGFRKLNPAEQRSFTREDWADDKYYAKWSTPLAYARVLDVAAKHGLSGIDGKKIVDFGYGDIGQLHLFARAGAHAVGVDPHPSLPIIYARADDQGKHGRGTVKLVHDRFPETDASIAGVGKDVDVFISKNTLKRGYVHPSRPKEVDPKKTLNLQVSDDVFLQRLHDALKPGGLVVIYNLAPAPSKPGEPYKPWAEGESPFTREQFGRAGFDVLAFDVDDTKAARAMGRALKWDQGEEQMNLDTDLFAWITVVKRKPQP